MWDASGHTLALTTPAGAQCLTVGNPSAGTAVIGRPLIDGSWALALLNAGPVPTVVSCDSTCLQQTGFEVRMLQFAYLARVL